MGNFGVVRGCFAACRGVNTRRFFGGYDRRVGVELADSCR